ncbi:hypothetical protein HZB02_01625, partial [Candidatus Woesearchaeota archaeon]|nr:hypothetical protein [Candidatus Woesearchaeota archaeon]
MKSYQYSGPRLFESLLGYEIDESIFSRQGQPLFATGKLLGTTINDGSIQLIF